MNNFKEEKDFLHKKLPELQMLCRLAHDVISDMAEGLTDEEMECEAVRFFDEYDEIFKALKKD
jgi:hypothetical protein